MLDISNVCRICLKEEDPKLPIFTENDEISEEKPTLPEKIMSLARVKVTKDDGLPMYICVKCYCQVDASVEFKRLCEESFQFFTRQLDVFAQNGGLSQYNAGRGKENANEYDSSERIHANYSDQVRQSLTEAAVSYNHHKLLHEELNKTEGYEKEQEEQVFRITGNESWIYNSENVNYETKIDSMVLKSEAIPEYFEFDLCNVKIENDGDGFFDDEGVNPLEIGSQGIPECTESPYCDLPPTSSNQETYNCHNSEIVFPGRREMAFHVSVAQGNCGTCDKYFHGNNINGDVRSRSDGEEDAAESCHLRQKPVKEMRGAHMWPRLRRYGVDEEGLESNAKRVKPMRKMIQCRLCDTVCATEKGFKIHLTCRHGEYRIVYACVICKSRRFFGKKCYIKHMTKKHEVVVNDNVDFELWHVEDCRTDFRRMFRRKRRKRNSSMVNGRVTSLNCMEEATDAAKSVKLPAYPAKRGRSTTGMTHPPFVTNVPVITNNFNVEMDKYGEKQYTCRGCNVTYRRYISAYNHYYSLNKKVEANQRDRKLHNCKFCSLKFASRSQAMMHKIHAHQFIKFGLDKK